MDGLLQPQPATSFDAIASTLSLAVYLAVAVLALARAPRDIRARVFLAVALTSAVPYALSPLQWWQGNAVYTPAEIAATAVSFAVGSAALFHFTQVFPFRRPWIRAHLAWLIAAYVIPPIPIAAFGWLLGSLTQQVAALDASGSGGLGAVSAGPVAIGVLLAVPLLIVVTVVLPCCGVLSLFKSWQEAKAGGNRPARVATLRMLISQMGGGVLAVLVLPLLRLVGLGPPWSTVVGALTYGCALIMPLAYAATTTARGRISTSA
jgi:hypothetical protein